MSLIEVMICAFVLSILGLGVAGMQGPVERTLGSDTRRMEARLRATRALEVIARQVRSASLASIRTLPPDFETWQIPVEGVVMDDLQFNSLLFDPESADELATASGPLTLSLAASNSDPENDVDDDHDGVVDSQRLVLERPGTPDLEVLDHLSACEFELNDRTLTLRVSVALRALNGNNIFESATSSVEIRND